jgi:response regulator RpfG family c-di-GMP phosphodiesterase
MGANPEPAERLARVQLALVESAAASTTGLLSFVSMLYRFSPEHLAHVHRVATTATALGRWLSLLSHELRSVERAALAHEIGRLVVPDMPGRDVEMGLSVSQALAGRDVLNVVPAFRPAARIVESLCERVDGTGSPMQLTQNAIPVGARVVAVADACDWLASVSVELALSRDLVAAELVRHAGTRFDPDIVAACVRWMDHGTWMSETRPALAPAV